MSSFTTPLVVTPLQDGRRWCLVFQFEYHIGSRWSQDKVTVPAGFVTDFASVPRPLWWWINYWGKHGKAAVLHDHCYQTHCRTRREADDIFYEAMLVGGTRPWKARVMYLAVRLFGWLAWGSE